MELGVYAFASVEPNTTDRDMTPLRRLHALLEEIELADQVGLDVCGVGEHHRADYAVSAPAVVLAAAAARTRRIRLTSAVSVLPTDDPVRLFEQFATLDLLSSGRAEIMVGRGSYPEPFPLFGFDSSHSEEQFDEKLDLLLRLRAGEHVTWNGRWRARLDGLGVYPRPHQEVLPIWVAVGGAERSAARVGALGLPLALAAVGGQEARFGTLLASYRDAAATAGHDPSRLQTSLNVHGFVAETSRMAADDYFGPRDELLRSIGRERGFEPPTRAQYDEETGPSGPIFVGDPEAVAEKIVATQRKFQCTRLLLHVALGAIRHAKVMKAIELLGTRVAPLVRQEIAAFGVTASTSGR